MPNPKIIRGSAIIEGWVNEDRPHVAVDKLLTELEGDIWGSDEYNTGNRDMTHVRVTIEVID